MLLIDILRAYFNAVTSEEEPTYVELPPESGAPPGTCALLRRHMYGTRRAAEGWQSECSATLRELGFAQGSASACVFRHKQRQLVCSVHGDDFTVAGPCSSLNWFEDAMKAKYELTVGGRLGPGPADAKEVRVLNRIVRWTSKGIAYEADPRQVEKLRQEIELEGSNGAATPGQKMLAHQIEMETELPERDFTKFRALAARANYLAADRIDVLYSAKECCRFMSRPTDAAMGALKRLARFLRARPRLVFNFEFQSATGLEVYTDTDWAGCPRTRKSTSGGCAMVGSHLVKAWSAIQASIALSSGEAEFYGVVRGVGIGLGLQALYHDLGITLPIRTWTDSSAALGIGGRQGLGRLRHLECHSLWVQQRLRRGEFKLLKVAGKANPADLFTKHLESRAKIDQLVGLFRCEYVEGRPAAAPALRRDAAAAHVVTELRELPHFHPAGGIDKLFPEAIAESPPLQEDDYDPQEELADPVPAINEGRRIMRESIARDDSRTGAGTTSSAYARGRHRRSHVLVDTVRGGDSSADETRRPHRRARPTMTTTEPFGSHRQRPRFQVRTDRGRGSKLKLVADNGVVNICAQEDGRRPISEPAAILSRLSTVARLHDFGCANDHVRSLVGSSDERPWGVFACGCFGASDNQHCIKNPSD